MTISDDGGITWNRVEVLVSPGPSDASAPSLDRGGFGNQFGDYTGLAFADGIVMPIWADNSTELDGNPDPRRFDAANARIGIAEVSRQPLMVQGLAFAGQVGNDDAVLLARFTDPDGALPAGSYKARIDWGDGKPASDGDIVANDDGSFGVRASHAYEATGSFTAKLTLSGPRTRGEAEAVGTIEPARKMLAFANEGKLRVVRELEFGKVLAVLSDANRGSKADDFDVTIDWGDGNFSGGEIALTRAGSTDGNPNVFSISGTHTYLDERSHLVRVTVRVKAVQGPPLLTVGAIVSGDPPMTLNYANDIEHALAGLTVGDRILAVFDVEGDIQTGVGEYIATINWGDGNVDANVYPQVNRNDGVTVVGRHTYAEAGEYFASATVVDDSGNVANAPLVVTVEPEATSRVWPVSSGLVYDPARDRFVGDLTLTSIDSADLYGPLQVVIQGLPEGVTLESTDKIDGAGDPLFKLDASRLPAGTSA